MKIALWCFLFSLSHLTFAQERWIDLEWDAVSGAKDYEVELFQEVDGTETPRGKYKTDTPVWSHAVNPGKYSLRIRSLDSRGVPGEWSEHIPLKVRLKNPSLLRPVPDDHVSDSQLNFEWAEAESAGRYQIVVKNESGDVILNSVTNELKMNAFLDSLGGYQWTVIALEKDESAKDEKEILQGQFRKFVRVGGELEAPLIGLNLQQKVVLNWNKVRNAKNYEIDYLPPKGSGDKNRRFHLKLSPLAFGKQKLREGVTTLTVKAQTPGFLDSRKSVVQISRSGDKIEVQDIIQGKGEEVIKVDPSHAQWRSQYFVGLLAGKYAYDSKDKISDTTLNQQKLTSLGINLDWHFQPRLNSYLHKFNVSMINLSSGIDSGLMARVAYTINKVTSVGNGKFHYGAGLSYLKVPSFMGNRIEDSVQVQNTSSVGPEISLAYQYPIGETWILEAQTQATYQSYFLSSDRDSEKAFLWMRASGIAYKYFTAREAFFFGADYRKWDQTWGSDTSALSGVSFIFGIKGGF